VLKCLAVANKVHAEWRRYSAFLDSLTSSNLWDIKQIHMLMHLLEDGAIAGPRPCCLAAEHILPIPAVISGLQPDSMKITIRHLDWFNWQRDWPLTPVPPHGRPPQHCVQVLLDLQAPASIKEFTVVLETIELKKTELNVIVEILSRMESKPRYPIVSTSSCPPESSSAKSSPVSAVHFVLSNPIHRWQWSRSPKLDNRKWKIFRGLEVLNLEVVELTWRNEPCVIDSP